MYVRSGDGDGLGADSAQAVTSARDIQCTPNLRFEGSGGVGAIPWTASLRAFHSRSMICNSLVVNGTYREVAWYGSAVGAEDYLESPRHYPE